MGNAIFYYNENTGARIFHLETLKIVIYGSPGVGFYIFDVRGGTVLHFGKRQYGAAVREIVNAREVELEIIQACSGNEKIRELFPGYSGNVTDNRICIKIKRVVVVANGITNFLRRVRGRAPILGS